MGRIGEKATGLSLPDSEELLGFPQWAAHGADLCPGHSSSQVTRYASGEMKQRGLDVRYPVHLPRAYPVTGWIMSPPPPMRAEDSGLPLWTLNPHLP